MSSDWYSGTADAIYQNIYTLERERPGHVVILSGDHVYRMDYSQLLEAHLAREADLTIACMEKPVEEAAGTLGVVAADRDSRITGFQEKPQTPAPSGAALESCLCSMGVYAFKTETLVRRVIEDAKRETSHDFGRDVIPAMVEGGDAVYAFPFEGDYWRDIGDLDTYWDAHMDLVSVRPVFNLYDAAWPIRGFRHCRAPAKIVFGGGAPDAPKAEVYNSLVCDGAIVSGAYVCDSVIGPGVHVEVGSRIEQSIILNATSVGRGVTIKRAVIDKANHLPDGARIGVDHDWDRRHFSVTDSGLVVMGKAVPFPSS
jgi:glucose-1-phosphate adenylyltransferase